MEILPARRRNDPIRRLRAVSSRGRQGGGAIVVPSASRREESSMGTFAHHRWDDMAKEDLGAGLARRIVTGERMMMAQVFFEQGRVVQRHAHENEQLTYILEGALEFTLGDGDVVVVAAGEVLHIPSWVPHEARALADTLDLDVFCPPRRDWLDGSDAYIRR
jgi:quercetin dioxygenase-like cupin family protein